MKYTEFPLNLCSWSCKINFADGSRSEQSDDSTEHPDPTFCVSMLTLIINLFVMNKLQQPKVFNIILHQLSKRVIHYFKCAT